MTRVHQVQRDTEPQFVGRGDNLPIRGPGCNHSSKYSTNRLFLFVGRYTQSSPPPRGAAAGWLLPSS